MFEALNVIIVHKSEAGLPKDVTVDGDGPCPTHSIFMDGVCTNLAHAYDL